MTLTRFVYQRSPLSPWPRRALVGIACPLSPFFAVAASPVAAGQHPRHCSAAPAHEAEALLRERFGTQAKLLLRPCPARRGIGHKGGEEDPEEEDPEEEEVEDEEPVAGGAAQHCRAGSDGPRAAAAQHYRASATCRLLGFPVELAAANGAGAEETMRRVLQEALESDVMFIRPAPRQQSAQSQSQSSQSTQSSSSSLSSSARGGRPNGLQKRGRGHSQRDSGPPLSPRQLEFKAIMDELRELCVHFSRVLKFSIKRPQSRHSSRGEESAEANEWRCRAYVRDEWGVAPSLSFTGASTGQSANDALMRCFAMLRDRYRAEIESPLVQLESVREVEAFVRPEGKTVESHCFEEDPNAEKQQQKKVQQKDNRRKGNETPTPTSSSLQEQQEQEQAQEKQQESTASPQDCPETMEGVEDQYNALRPTTFTAAIIVEDKDGNINVSQAKRQPTPLAAYQNVALQALRAEAALSPSATLTDASLPPVPLLVRMRWQFDSMICRLAQSSGEGTLPDDIAAIHIDGDANKSSSSASVTSPNQPQQQLSQSSAASASSSPLPSSENKGLSDGPSLFFTASFVLRGVVVWERCGMGRYRVEFDCYAYALAHLIRLYPELARACVAEAGGVLFPTVPLLELAVSRHDNFSVIANHRGKWNGYAVLGTITSHLIGSYYQTVYTEDRAAGEARATLTVNDGARSNQLLIQRQAKRRGEAWRNACLDALRENFPTQYTDALIAHPDIDLSADTMARGSKYRALPREKRVQHLGNILSLVGAFAEEDLGWHNLRVRLRNASGELGLPHWVAEMEAQVDGEEQRRVVAVSPPYPQARHARRVLVYQLAEKYFPKELAAYARLGRDDALNPDQDARAAANAVYRAGTTSFIGQAIALLEECAASMGPYTWTIEMCGDDSGGYGNANDGSVECLLHSFAPRFRAAILGQGGDLLVSERVGTAGESAVAVLCSALRAATDRFAGDRGEQLWTEYESHAPPPVSSSRELALYMFNAFFGVARVCLADEAATAPSAEPSVVELDARELGGYWFVTLSFPRVGGLAVARAISTSKREGTRDALLVACRRCFPRALHYLAAHSKEASAFATEIISAPVVETLPASVIRDIRQTIEKAEAAGPPRPYTLLLRCVTRDYRNERWLRVEQIPNSGGGFQCRIYLQKHRRESKKGDVQLVGFGAALSRPQALHVASICALENLFEADLAEAVSRDMNYKDLPQLE